MLEAWYHPGFRAYGTARRAVNHVNYYGKENEFAPVHDR